MTLVVAGIIEQDRRILICRRRADQRHALQWEFPGGKVEAGETAAAALARELEEELGIHADIGHEITRYPFAYPGRNPIELIFFRVVGYTGELRNRIFAEMRWEVLERLPEYDFVEGDVDFVRAMAAGAVSI
jgi:8-oxo-dGTP diphosphatase